ncbi:DUF397 domain-containing protein [Actinomadura sp. NPDC000600]|uniref:DUF397 domain-containing protein n=1 Tax=Actinomadura sp. NPDC000600 TaxID=3154262 RepID=UPI003397C21C
MSAQDSQAMQRLACRHGGEARGQRVEVELVPPKWRKSSYSTDTGDQCVELAPLKAISTEWRKSTWSADTGGQCIEVADLASGVAVRDSKDPDGPKLVFGAAAWEVFAGKVKGGHLDLT